MEIYNKYFTNVYRFARRLSQDAHMADELTQQTFFEAMRMKRPDFARRE